MYSQITYVYNYRQSATLTAGHTGIPTSQTFRHTDSWTDRQLNRRIAGHSISFHEVNIFCPSLCPESCGFRFLVLSICHSCIFRPSRQQAGGPWVQPPPQYRHFYSTSSQYKYSQPGGGDSSDKVSSCGNMRN